MTIHRIHRSQVSQKRAFGCSLVGLVTIAACTQGGVAGNQADAVENRPHTFVFEGISAPLTPEEKRSVRSASRVTIDGTSIATGYKTMLRGGDKLGGSTFGAITDIEGDAVRLEDGSPLVDNTADFTSLLPVGNKLFSVTHFESSKPSAMYLTELRQDAKTGELEAVATRPIDFRTVGGLWTPCAGSVTPWNTHFGSEEYEPDGRAFGEAKSIDEVDRIFRLMTRYFKVDPQTATLEKAREVLNPYRYGYPVEVRVDEAGATTVTKHYGMGRRAMELAYVMPDKKTVYMTDDGDNTGFYMFVADKEADLSRGRLFAMKWNQTSAEGGGAADIEWVGLGGSASDDEVKALVDKRIVFTDIFETEAPTESATCSSGFKAVRSGDQPECLKLKKGMELAAARLETRRYAAYLGATTEMNKEEGFTFDPDSMTAYVAVTDIGASMLDGSERDRGGPNHVRLPPNLCGAVYALQVGGDAALGTSFAVKSWKAIVAGTPAATPGTCEIENIANPDNLTLIRGYGTLVIGEDCGKAQHQNDAMWTLDLATKKLTRILTTPYGAETTSPYFYPNINGHAYLMSVVQHPYGESDQAEAQNTGDPIRAKAPYVGYFGPFPRMDRVTY